MRDTLGAKPVACAEVREQSCQFKQSLMAQQAACIAAGVKAFDGQAVRDHGRMIVDC